MLGKVSELYGLGKGESLEILEQGNNMVQGTAHLLSLTQEASISPGHMPGSGVPSLLLGDQKGLKPRPRSAGPGLPHP
jgi:hypothetical protein